MKQTIKVGYIGCGRRGRSILKECLAKMRDVEVKYICDASQQRMERATAHLLAGGAARPQFVTDYHEILRDPEIDAVFVMTGWSGRPQIAMEVMRAGKYVAIEVGCADTLEECFALVDTYEETGTPLMMLENCCYGRRELAALNIIKKGLFGEVVHASGGYLHYLNEGELFRDIDTAEIPHYRIGHYRDRNRESYPTHELGPLAKALDINRGNRMVRLSSFASKSCGLKQYAADHLGADSVWAKTEYKQGDIVNTIITCADGATILLTLDTTLPRPYYSRGFSIRGTKGMCYEDGNVFYFAGMPETRQNKGNEGDMMEQYEHPLQKEYRAATQEGGAHADGIDWLVCRAFVESVKAGTLPPIDVYDAAAWMAVGPLSEQSIAQNGAPVDFPDFTRGKWQNREPAAENKYALHTVIEDDSMPIFPKI
ncbi:MAG: Gfo/Idh/MocA family oxidoreductase [Ruminococcaceae bacterium]|nr:Gfo/Idh/MocA family oxidoreductase [Oscillospiraceae bacterium]